MIARAIAVLLVVSGVAAIVACDGPHACRKTSISDDNPELWNVSYTGCVDKKKYAVLCVPDTSIGVVGIRKCSCAVDAVVTRTFSYPLLPPSDEEMLTPVMNAQCGWAINTD
jgi:hypothetical protein